MSDMLNCMPDLPLMCLGTASSTSTIDAFKGKNVVIDFWTTKCVRCPEALDRLDTMASQPEYADVQFVSICCDSCDGARNIIENDDVPRWGRIDHYHMEDDDKEIAKQVLGFSQVPFYVILNDGGEIVQMGSSKKVNFDTVPGMITKENGREEAMSASDWSEINFGNAPKRMKEVPDSPISTVEVERVFCIDEDF